MRKWPTNVGDVRCQQLSQGRTLPTNQRDPPKLINCNELRGGDCRYSSAVRHGNWFEQRVFESGYQNGVGPALAPFIKDGLPFQTSPEQALFHSTQGRFRTEQTERFINPPDYVGPSAQMQKANDTHFKATMQSNPTSDFNMLNAAENPGKLLKHRTGTLTHMRALTRCITPPPD